MRPESMNTTTPACLRFSPAMAILGVGILLVAGIANVAVAAEEGKSPNILLLFGDDLGKYASVYATSDRPSPNDIVRTPVFDRIAAEGALFHNAVVSAPSCTPSRAALYTGRHFFRNGSHSQLHHPWQRGASDPFDSVKGM